MCLVILMLKTSDDKVLVIYGFIYLFMKMLLWSLGQHYQ